MNSLADVLHPKRGSNEKITCQKGCTSYFPLLAVDIHLLVAIFQGILDVLDGLDELIEG